MKLKEAIQILKDHNSWRRSESGQMIDPKLIGIAIDKVLSEVKNPDKEDILIEFQIYLNEQKLINNHDWDFEKEARKFIKQKKHETHKPLRPNAFTR